MNNFFRLAEEAMDSEFIYHGERAMHHLKLVEERLGVFDKALINHVELKNYFKGFDESLKVLRQHFQNNPTNPNSIKYAITAWKVSKQIRTRKTPYLDTFQAVHYTVRGVFRIQSNIYDRAFCENSDRL